MSAIDQITTLLETMTFADKLVLNERIATAIRKEGGKPGSKKAAKAATAEGDAKPKRRAAAGTLAWTAFVKHIKTTQPDAFEGITKESDKLKTVKIIREGDLAAYDAFVAEWKTNYAGAQAEGAEEAEAEAEEVVVAVPPPKAMTPKEKLAAAKAAKAAAASSTPAAPAPAKKEVKKAKAAPAKKAAKEEELPQMSTLTLDNVEYWHLEATNGLWKKEDDTFAGQNWTGYYQPGNEEEPIRYTNDVCDE